MTRQQLLRKRLVALVDALLARHEDKLLPEEAEEPEEIIDERVHVQIWEGHRLPRLSPDDAHAMDEIIDALRRVDAGTYGRCVMCGDAVGFHRLQDSPTARMCESCASDEMWRPFAPH